MIADSERRRTLARKYALFLGGGFVYLCLCRLLGFGIPCPFHLLTGLYCPGCGATTMAVCLLTGDCATAFNANPALFCAAPVIVGSIIYSDLAWLKDGRRKELPDTVFYALLVYFFLFAVYRNMIFN